MTTTAPKAPKNAKEAAAYEQAVAGYYLSRVQAAHDVMTGPQAQAFQAKVAELLAADDLPAGTSVAVNLPAVAQWFSDVQTGLEADLERLDAVVNPPAPDQDEPDAEAA